MGYITLTATVTKDEETNEYVVRCSELGISTMASDPVEALPRIREAVAVYLDALTDVGERDRVFAERGIQVNEDDPPLVTEVRARVRPGDFVSPLSVPVPAA